MKTEMKLLIASLSVFAVLFSGVAVLEDSDASVEDSYNIDEKGWLHTEKVLPDGIWYYKAIMSYDSDILTWSYTDEDIILNLADLDYISLQSDDDPRFHVDEKYKVKSIHPISDKEVKLTSGATYYADKGYLFIEQDIDVEVNVENISTGALHYFPKISVPITINLGFVITSLGSFVYNGTVQNITDGPLMVSDELAKALNILYGIPYNGSECEATPEMLDYITFTEGKSGKDAGEYEAKWLILLPAGIGVTSGTPWEILKKNLHNVLVDDQCFENGLTKDKYGNVIKDPVLYEQLRYNGKPQDLAIKELYDISADKRPLPIWGEISKYISGDIQGVDVGLYKMSVSLPGDARGYYEGVKNYWGDFDIEWSIHKATITSDDVKFYEDSFGAVPADPKAASNITIEKDGKELVKNGNALDDSATFRVVSNGKDTFAFYYDDEKYTTEVYVGFGTMSIPEDDKFVEEGRFVHKNIKLPFTIHVVTLEGTVHVNIIHSDGGLTTKMFTDDNVFIYPNIGPTYIVKEDGSLKLNDNNDFPTIDRADYWIVVRDADGNIVLDEYAKINCGKTESEWNSIELYGIADRGFVGYIVGSFYVDLTGGTPGLRYNEFGNQVVGYDGEFTDITIPATNGGVKVTKIADKAFFGNKKITSVFIGDNVRSVGMKSFANCVNLKSVCFGASVKVISYYAFYGCKNLEEVDFNYELTAIRTGAFSVSFQDGTGKALGMTAKDLADKSFMVSEGVLGQVDYIPRPAVA